MDPDTRKVIDFVLINEDNVAYSVVMKNVVFVELLQQMEGKFVVKICSVTIDQHIEIHSFHVTKIY